MVPPDYRLIAITAPDLHPGVSVEDACRAAAAGGATALQVRLKEAPASEMLRLTERLLAAVDIPVYVNDRLDVALASGAHGVHLGADDLPPGRIGSHLPRALRVGLSVGSASEAAAAMTAPGHYWSLGPFLRTTTKLDAGVPLGPAGFRQLAALAPSQVPVIAIGGIGFEHIPAVVQAGAEGVAVLSAIFAASGIEGATRRLRDELDACLP